MDEIDMTKDQLYSAWDKCHSSLLAALRDLDTLLSEGKIMKEALRRITEDILSLDEVDYEARTALVLVSGKQESDG